MWVRAGFSPDDLWKQTPLHFQLAMEGVRKRLEQDAESQLHLAYQTGAFSALGYHGKLKPFGQYRKADAAMSPRDMVSMLQSMGAKSNMTIKRVKRAND